MVIFKNYIVHVIVLPLLYNFLQNVDTLNRKSNNTRLDRSLKKSFQFHKVLRNLFPGQIKCTSWFQVCLQVAYELVPGLSSDSIRVDSYKLSFTYPPFDTTQYFFFFESVFKTIIHVEFLIVFTWHHFQTLKHLKRDNLLDQPNNKIYKIVIYRLSYIVIGSFVLCPCFCSITSIITEWSR